MVVVRMMRVCGGRSEAATLWCRDRAPPVLWWTLGSLCTLRERDIGFQTLSMAYQNSPLKRQLKKLAARLPRTWVSVLKRAYFARQIRRRSFRAPEPEFDQLSTLVAPGDWVLDIGANVGHYTLRLSELVGEGGRVIAFEPVLNAFEILAANAALAGLGNVTLINAAVSDSAEVSGMSVPKYADTGLENLYMARLSEDDPSLQVLCLSVDSVTLPHAISLAKIDTEGHELSVLRGMAGILRRDRPLLIVEDNDPEVAGFLAGLGYAGERMPGSSNQIFRWVR